MMQAGRWLLARLALFGFLKCCFIQLTERQGESGENTGSVD